MKHSIFVALSLTVACACTATGLEKIKPHPRLFADAAGFEALKASLATDELVRRGAAYVHRDADKQLTEAIPERKIKDGRRLLSVSHAIGDRILLHAMTYRLFGDRRHLAKAEELMHAAVAFTDWNPSHFLDVAVMSFGVAVGYDWLYDDLSPDSRATIRAGLVRHGLDPGLAKRNIRRARSNWGQVCSGGILAAALAVAEDEPEKCRRVLEELRQDLPRTMAMYRPNGSYPEGPGYWNFGTGYNVRIIAMLESALGDDFGLAAQPCFRETGYYLDFMTGPTGRFFNYSDCSDKRSTSWITWWFARRFGEPGWVEPFEREAYLQELAKVCGRRISPLTLFYLFPRPPDVKVNLPLAWRSDGATDVAVLRSSWEKDGRFAGFKGGKATNPHGHMDGGSFIYEAKGVRWALDLGGENYAKAGTLGVGLGRRKLRESRTCRRHGILVVPGGFGALPRLPVECERPQYASARWPAALRDGQCQGRLACGGAIGHGDARPFPALHQRHAGDTDRHNASGWFSRFRQREGITRRCADSLGYDDKGECRPRRQRPRAFHGWTDTAYDA